MTARATSCGATRTETRDLADERHDLRQWRWTGPGTDDWTIAGVGDFDGDGKADILWRNTASGDNAIWLMDGIALASGAAINNVPGTDWAIVGVSDYNGDYMSDILWRNSALGTNYIWSMNGFTLQSACGAMGCTSGYLPGVSATGWSIVNTR